VASRELSTQIVENAVVATGTAWVHLTEYDPEQRVVRTVASAGRHIAAVQRVIDFARTLHPGWDPNRLTISVDVNPINRAIYLEGQAVVASLADVAEGIVDRRFVRVAEAMLGIRFCLVLPLHVGGRVAGSITFPLPAPPSSALRSTCEGFARQVELTLENAELSRALHVRVAELGLSRQRLIATEERLRREIAELLHSRVQSRLLVAWHRLGQYEAVAAEDPVEAARLVADVRTEIDRVREEGIRRAAHLLHPSIVQLGLVPAVQALVEQFAPALAVDLRVEPAVVAEDDPVDSRFGEPLRLVVYRVLEEALNNVVRHAGARAAAIALGLDPAGWLVVSLRDDGRGFDAAGSPRGLGLSGIVDRVEHADGEWTIESSPGAGTTLTVRLPLSVARPVAPSPA
jgi:signal transduction histidine kinase